MYDSLKKIIVGSPLESVARKAYYFIKGYDTALIERNNRYDQQALEVMRRCLKKDSNCVDVGCHSGAVLAQMLDIAPDGNHFAFEPIPELYERLVTSFPNVTVRNLALSDRSGESTFQHVTSNPAYSGLRKRRYDRPHETVREISVSVDLLDNIIPHDHSVDLIKIDVEGAELQVLKGAAETIRRCKPVLVFEHGLGSADFYGTRPEDVFDLLTLECGLNISLMEVWLTGREHLTAEEFAGQFYEGKNFYFMAHPARS